MNAQPKQAKVVLNMRNGITEEEYRNSFKELDYFKNYHNEEGNAKMDVRWRVDARALGLPRNGNKYFGGYGVCATGMRIFVGRSQVLPTTLLREAEARRNVQEVAVAERGQPRRGCIMRVNTCGNCKQPGHSQAKCRFIPVWFDWGDQEDHLFQQVYRRSIPGPQ